VIAAGLERLERDVPADALVLDVGGWAKPLARADWVLDIEAYTTRGRWGHDGGREAERFTADTWVQRDLCAREPWPFADDQFDFAVCSHTLEDLRDPVWVCSELERVARAGYVEVPAAVEELTWGVNGEWVGWSHHRWICTVTDGALELVYKPHLLVREGLHLPAGTCDALAPEERVATLWWEGALPAHERVFTDPDAFDRWLAGLLADHRRPRRRWRR
jgi:methyltransferase family protein